MQARRSSRIRLTAPALCKSSRGFSWDIEIADLSQGGCRVDDPRHGLELGAHIELTIAEVGPYPAEVAWRQGDRVGLEFVAPLPPTVFEPLSQGRWDDARTAAQGFDNPALPIRYPVRRIM